MGINSKRVDAVIHAGFSWSFTDYVRESGGAGRGNQPAKCIVVYNRSLAQNFMRIVRFEVQDNVKLMFSEANATWPPKAGSSSGGDTEASLALSIAYVESTQVCRRQALYTTVDERSPDPMYYFSQIGPPIYVRRMPRCE